MTEPDRIRMSDDDREQFAERLRMSYAEGRLTETELEDRLQTVYAARFESELQAVTADLPVPIAAAPTTSVAGRTNDVARVLRSMAQWYFPALICTAIWAVTSFGGYFWPIWVYFGLTIPFISSLIFDGDPDDGETDDDGGVETV